MKKPKIIIKDRIYIPKSMVSIADLNKHYVYTFKAKNKDESDEIIKLWKTVLINDIKYVAVPNGNFERVEQCLGVKLNNIVDKRANVPMKIDLKWTGNLYKGEIVKGKKTTNQVKVTKQWLKNAYGVLKAPPRSGKTFMSVYIICQLKQRALIFADQKELLKQFIKAFYSMTNIKALEKKHGRQLIGIVKKPEDFKKYEIALVTYQSFIREKGQEIFDKYVKGKRGISVGDEIHGSAALAYSKFCIKLDSRYKLALSATPKRKDDRYRVVEDIFGPVTAESKVVAMTPEIRVVETGIKPKRKYKSYFYAMKFITTHEERNKIIVKNVFKDLRAGHEGIIIPVMYKDHMSTLVTMINNQARLNRIKKGEDFWPKNTAVAFHGQTDREKLIDDFDNKKFKVLVGILKLVKQGVTFVTPSSLHVPIPVSASMSQRDGSPLFEQLVNRICTPAEGKKDPQATLYVDGLDLSVGAFRKLFKNEIRPRLKFFQDTEARYIMNSSDRDKASKIADSNTRNYSVKIGRAF